jgi:DNA (cytosine-5)-methyltransferase 1
VTGLTFGSLFAGVGGFDLGFESAGYECRFQVEWDPHCQQTLAHRWPQVPRWSDVSDVSGFELPPVDVVTYGFPCQDLSVAGKRAGLDGQRSHLFFEAVRIITEMRQATNGRYPTWAVAENVAGLLNADGGSAMARVVDELAAAGAVVIEWATLDAQWFGVPQRRRRVFIASNFNPAVAGRCPDPLFPVASSSARNPSESHEARQDSAGDAASGIGFALNSIGGYDTGVGTFRRVSSREWADDDTGACLAARDYKDHGDLITQPIGFVAEGGSHSVTPLDNLSPTVRVGSGVGIPSPPAVVQPDLAVRRLTPVECERLMGWPDDHTLHRADGKTNSDSVRYKMCGNGVVAPVARWVAKHLAATMEPS